MKTKYVGYSDNKIYNVFEVDSNYKNIGLIEVEGYTGKQWRPFDKIEKRNNTTKVNNNLHKKVLIEIEIPKGKESCLKDEFKFTEFLAKKLTRKWFGCGCFAVAIKKILHKTKGLKMKKCLNINIISGRIFIGKLLKNFIKKG